MSHGYDVKQKSIVGVVLLFLNRLSGFYRSVVLKKREKIVFLSPHFDSVTQYKHLDASEHQLRIPAKSIFLED